MSDFKLTKPTLYQPGALNCPNYPRIFAVAGPGVPEKYRGHRYTKEEAEKIVADLTQQDRGLIARLEDLVNAQKLAPAFPGHRPDFELRDVLYRNAERILGVLLAAKACSKSKNKLGDLFLAVHDLDRT